MAIEVVPLDTGDYWMILDLEVYDGSGAPAAGELTYTQGGEAVAVDQLYPTVGYSLAFRFYADAHGTYALHVKGLSGEVCTYELTVETAN